MTTLSNEDDLFQDPTLTYYSSIISYVVQHLYNIIHKKHLVLNPVYKHVRINIK